MSRVPVQPIREAVEEYIAKGGSWSELCRRLDWMETDTKPESTRVQRSLGIKPDHGIYTTRIFDRNAVKIILAIDRSPHEFDL